MIGLSHFGLPHDPWVHLPVTYTMACPTCGADCTVTSRALVVRDFGHVPDLCMPCSCSPCPCWRCEELRESVA